MCLRCRISTVPAGPRLFSTAPPPPREPIEPVEPIKPARDDSNSSTSTSKTTSASTDTSHSSKDNNTSDPEPAAPEPQDALFVASPTPRPPPPPPEQSKPEESAPASPPSSPPSSSSSSSPSSSSPSSPADSPPPSEPPSEPQSEPPPPPPPRAKEKEEEEPDRTLPSFTENHRHPLSARFSTFMDNLQSRVLTATQTINDLTGYSAIEAIKRRNSELERELAAAQRRLREARQAYKTLTAHRAATQREVTTLLARKDAWSPPDVERFTTLYRSDHELEARVAAAAAELTEAEADEARLSGELNAGILKRYHEEQIWSDRIRRQSTWGTWGLMGVNVVLFLVLQFVAEPWRRRRLMRGIAEHEAAIMDEVRRELGEVRAALEESAVRQTAGSSEGDATPAAAVADGETQAFGAEEEGGNTPTTTTTTTTTPFQKPWKELIAEYWADPELLKEAVRDLYSERRTELRMRDISLIALEGAAAGATLVAALSFAVLRSTRS